MALTEQTLKMARISGLDYAQATDYMTNAVRSFKMEMTDAQRIVDVYSNIAASSATSTSELAEAMSKTASSASAVGSSFENTTAMMAVMIEATREAPQNIGSALKSIISRYGEMKADPTALIDSEGQEMSLNKVDKALKTVGISIQDANHQFRDFDDVITELAGKWNTIDTNTQRYIATIMAGNRQQSRFLALVSSGERLAELSEKAANSEDTATLQVLKTMDSIEAKTQQFKTSLQSLYVDSGIENLFKGILDIGNNIVKTLADMTRFGKAPILAITSIATNFVSLASVVTNVFAILKARFDATSSSIKAKMQADTAEGVNYTINLTEQEFQQMKATWDEEEQVYRLHVNNMNNIHKTGVDTRTTQEKGGVITNTANGSGGNWLSQHKVGVSMAANMGGLVLNTIGANIKGPWGGITGATGAGLQGFGLGLSMGGPVGGIVGAVLGGISGLISNWSKIAPSLEQQVKEAKEAATEKQNTYLQSKSENKDLEENIANLKKLELARHDSKEAEEEYFEATSQLAEKYPNLIESVDKAGNVILDLDNAENILTQSRLKAADAARDAAIANYNAAKTAEKEAEKEANENRDKTYATNRGVIGDIIARTVHATSEENDPTEDIEYAIKESLPTLTGGISEITNDILYAFSSAASEIGVSKLDAEDNYNFASFLLKLSEINPDLIKNLSFKPDNFKNLNTLTNYLDTIDINTDDASKGLKGLKDIISVISTTATFSESNAGAVIDGNIFSLEKDALGQHYKGTKSILKGHIKSIANLTTEQILTVFDNLFTSNEEDFKNIVDKGNYEDNAPWLSDLIKLSEQNEDIVLKTLAERYLNIFEGFGADVRELAAAEQFTLSTAKSGIANVVSEQTRGQGGFFKDVSNANALLTNKAYKTFIGGEDTSQTAFESFIKEGGEESQIISNAIIEYNDFWNKLSAKQQKAVANLISSSDKYSAESFETALQKITDSTKDLPDIVDDIYTEEAYTVENFNKALADRRNSRQKDNKKELEFLNDIEEFSFLGESQFKSLLNVFDTIENYFDSGVLSEKQANKFIEQYTALLKKINADNDLSPEIKAEAEYVMTSWEDFSLTGMHTLAQKLQDLGIEDTKDQNDIISTVENLYKDLPVNILSEVRTFTDSIISKSEDFSKVLSSAEKGFDLKGASDVANKLGKNISEVFDYRDGKFFTKNMTELYEGYLGVDNELKGTIEEEVNSLNNISSKYSNNLNNIFKSVESELSFDKDLTIENALGKLASQGERIQEADISQLADIYRRYWDAAKVADMTISEYLKTQGENAQKDLEIIEKAEKDAWRSSLIQAGQIENFINSFADESDKLPTELEGLDKAGLKEKILSEDWSAIPEQLKDFTSELWKYYQNQGKEVYEAAISSIQSGKQLVQVTSENQEIINQLTGENYEIGDSAWIDFSKGSIKELRASILNSAFNPETKRSLLSSLQKAETELDSSTILKNVADSYDNMSYEIATNYARLLGLGDSLEEALTKEVGKLYIGQDESGNYFANRTLLWEKIANDENSTLKERNEALAKLEQKEQKEAPTTVFKDIIKDRNKLNEDNLASLATTLKISYSQVLNLVEKNNDGTYSISLGKIQQIVDNSNTEIQEALQESLSAAYEEILTNISGLSSKQSSGYTDLGDMEEFVKQIQQLGITSVNGKEIDISTLFEYNDSLRAYQLSTDGIIAQIAYLRQNFDKMTAEEQKVAMHLMQTTRRQFADQIDASALIEAIGTDQFEQQSETFTKSVEDYNAVLVAWANGSSKLGLNAEELIKALQEGGADAVNAISQIAQRQGKQLTAEQATAAFRSKVSKYVESIEKLTSKPGEIVDETTAEIINETDGVAVQLGSSGAYLVTTAANLAKAYLDLYNKLAGSGEATIAELNQVMGAHLENRDGEQRVIDALGDASKMTYTRFGEILAQEGILLTEDLITQLDNAGIIKQLGGANMAITNFKGLADIMGWKAGSEEYVSAFKTFNDSLIEMNRQAERNILEEVKNVTSAKGGDWVNLTQLMDTIYKNIIPEDYNGNVSNLRNRVMVDSDEGYYETIFGQSFTQKELLDSYASELGFTLASITESGVQRSEDELKLYAQRLLEKANFLQNHGDNRKTAEIIKELDASEDRLLLDIVEGVNLSEEELINKLEERAADLHDRQAAWYNLLHDLPEFGAYIEDGILKLADNADLASIARLISESAEISGGLISSEMAELADAIADALKGYADLIKNGISGSLTNVQANELQSFADNYGVGKLDFTPTVDGLKLSEESAIKLYETISDLDVLQGQVVFSALQESLTSSHTELKNISTTSAAIAKTQRQIQENSKKIFELEKIQNLVRDKEKLQNNIDNLKNENEELEKQLELYNKIAIAQSSTPESFDFMNRDMPNLFKGPQNYWNSVGDAFKAMKTASSTGKMEIQDFYNIVQEMSNLAVMSGQDLTFMGQTLYADGTGAAELIQKSLSALTNIDGEGVKINMQTLAAQLGVGVKDMSAGFDDAIKEMAKSQIAMLDGMIQLLETIVAMENLGDLDTSGDGIIQMPDLVGDDGGYTENTQEIFAALQNQEEVKKLLDNFFVAGKSLTSWMNMESGELKGMSDEAKDQFAAALNALWQMYNSDDFDLENLPQNIQELMEKFGLNGTWYVEDPDNNWSIIYQIDKPPITIEWDDYTEEDLKNMGFGGKDKTPLEEAKELLEKYASGNLDKVDTEKILSTLELVGEVQIETNEETGNNEYYFNKKGPYTKDQIQNMIKTSKDYNVGLENIEYTDADQLVITKVVDGVVVQIDTGKKNTFEIDGQKIEANNEQKALEIFYQTNALRGSGGQIIESKKEMYTRLGVEVNEEIDPTITSDLSTPENQQILRDTLFGKNGKSIKEAFEKASGGQGNGKEVEVEIAEGVKIKASSEEDLKNKVLESLGISNLVAAITLAIQEAFSGDNANSIGKAISDGFVTGLGTVGEEGFPADSVKVILSALDITIPENVKPTFNGLDGTITIPDAVDANGTAGKVTIGPTTDENGEGGWDITWEPIPEQEIDQVITGTGEGQITNVKWTYNSQGENTGTVVSAKVPIIGLPTEVEADANITATAEVTDVEFVYTKNEDGESVLTSIDTTLNGEPISIPIGLTPTTEGFTEAVTTALTMAGYTSTAASTVVAALVGLQPTLKDNPDFTTALAALETGPDINITTNAATTTWEAWLASKNNSSTVEVQAEVKEYDPYDSSRRGREATYKARTTNDTNALQSYTNGQNDIETYVKDMDDLIQKGQALSATDFSNLSYLKDVFNQDGSHDLLVADIERILNASSLISSDQIDALSSMGQNFSNLEVGELPEVATALQDVVTQAQLLEKVDWNKITEGITNVASAQTGKKSSDGENNTTSTITSGSSNGDSGATNLLDTSSLGVAIGEVNSMVSSIGETFSKSAEEINTVSSSVEDISNQKILDLKDAANSISTSKIDAVKSAINGLSGSIKLGVTIGVTVEGNNNAKGTVNTASIRSGSGTIEHTNSSVRWKNHKAYAKGTLMGELGPELVVSHGRYFVVGQNGPEMVDLADDAIVFNHIQTRQLLSNGRTSTYANPVTNERKAVAMAEGNGDLTNLSSTQVSFENNQINTQNLTVNSANTTFNGELNVHTSIKYSGGRNQEIDTKAIDSSSILRKGRGKVVKPSEQRKGFTANAKGTLMGELGPEMVVSNGRYFLVGENGPEMVNLADDAIVFNHLQTRELLSKGKIGTRGQAITNDHKATSLATGNAGPAMASASEALEILKQLRSMWQSLLKASIKDLAGTAAGGGGGGGGGGKTAEEVASVVEELERWYNWEKKIETAQDAINKKTKEYTLLEKRGASTSEKLANLMEQRAITTGKLATQQDLLANRRESYNQEVTAAIQNTPLGNVFELDENNKLRYKTNTGKVALNVEVPDTYSQAEADDYNKKNAKKIKKGKVQAVTAGQSKGEGQRKASTIEVPTGGLALLAELQRNNPATNLPQYDAKTQMQILDAMGYGDYLRFEASGKPIDTSEEGWEEKAVQNVFDRIKAQQENFEGQYEANVELGDNIQESEIELEDITDSIEDLTTSVQGVVDSLDEWYDLDQKIASAQNRLNLLNAEYNGLQQDSATTTSDLINNLREQYAESQKTLTSTREKQAEQEQDLAEDRAKLEQSNFVRKGLWAFDENGRLIQNDTIGSFQQNFDPSLWSTDYENAVNLQLMRLGTRKDENGNVQPVEEWFTEAFDVSSFDNFIKQLTATDAYGNFKYNKLQQAEAFWQAGLLADVEKINGTTYDINTEEGAEEAVKAALEYFKQHPEEYNQKVNTVEEGRTKTQEEINRQKDLNHQILEQTRYQTEIIDHLDEWYNISRDIVDAQNELNLKTVQYDNLTKKLGDNSKALTDNLRDQASILNKELISTENELPKKQAKFEKDKNKFLSENSLFFVDNGANGVKYADSTGLVNLARAAGTQVDDNNQAVISLIKVRDLLDENGNRIQDENGYKTEEYQQNITLDLDPAKLVQELSSDNFSIKEIGQILKQLGLDAEVAKAGGYLTLEGLTPDEVLSLYRDYLSSISKGDTINQDADELKEQEKTLEEIKGKILDANNEIRESLKETAAVTDHLEDWYEWTQKIAESQYRLNKITEEYNQLLNRSYTQGESLEKLEEQRAETEKRISLATKDRDEKQEAYNKSIEKLNNQTDAFATAIRQNITIDEDGRLFYNDTNNIGKKLNNNTKLKNYKQEYDENGREIRIYTDENNQQREVRYGDEKYDQGVIKYLIEETSIDDKYGKGTLAKLREMSFKELRDEFGKQNLDGSSYYKGGDLYSFAESILGINAVTDYVKNNLGKNSLEDLTKEERENVGNDIWQVIDKIIPDINAELDTYEQADLEVTKENTELQKVDRQLLDATQKGEALNSTITAWYETTRQINEEQRRLNQLATEYDGLTKSIGDQTEKQISNLKEQYDLTKQRIETSKEELKMREEQYKQNRKNAVENSGGFLAVNSSGDLVRATSGKVGNGAKTIKYDTGRKDANGNILYDVFDASGTPSEILTDLMGTDVFGRAKYSDNSLVQIVRGLGLEKIIAGSIGFENFEGLDQKTIEDATRKWLENQDQAIEKTNQEKDGLEDIGDELKKDENSLLDINNSIRELLKPTAGVTEHLEAWYEWTRRTVNAQQKLNELTAKYANLEKMPGDNIQAMARNLENQVIQDQKQIKYNEKTINERKTNLAKEQEKIQNSSLSKLLSIDNQGDLVYSKRNITSLAGQSIKVKEQLRDKNGHEIRLKEDGTQVKYGEEGYDDETNRVVETTVTYNLTGKGGIFENAVDSEGKIDPEKFIEILTETDVTGNSILSLEQQGAILKKIGITGKDLTEFGDFENWDEATAQQRNDAIAAYIKAVPEAAQRVNGLKDEIVSLEIENIQLEGSVLDVNNKLQELAAIAAGIQNPFEQWHSWLQKIKREQNELNLLTKEYNNNEKERVNNGALLGQQLLKQLEYYKQQSQTQQEFLNKQNIEYENLTNTENWTDAQRKFFRMEDGKLEYNDEVFSGQVKNQNGIKLTGGVDGKGVYNYRNVNETIDFNATGIEDFLEKITEQNADNSMKYNTDQQFEILKAFGFSDQMMYDASGNPIFKNGIENATKEEREAAVKAVLDNLKGFQEKVEGAEDQIQSTTEAVVDANGNIIDIKNQIQDNELELENKIMQAIEDREQKRIDELREQKDMLSEAANNFLDGLSEQLDKEKKMYERQENQDELIKLQRQLAILQRSGGSASQINSLQEQIRSKQQDTYFQERQDQIDAVKEASDKQIEKLEKQIEIAEETLAYNKENGLLWNEVREIMKQDSDAILSFINENLKERQSQSSLQSELAITDDGKIVGQFVGIRGQTFKSGGLIDYTGPAWVDGSKQKPESVLNAAQTEFLREQLLDSLENFSLSINKFNNNFFNSSALNNLGENSSINIEQLDFVMKVDSISNDYEARRAGQQAFEEMVRIARKAGNHSVSRR